MRTLSNILNDIALTWPDSDMGFSLYPRPKARDIGSWFSHYSGSTEKEWSPFTLNIVTSTEEESSISVDVDDFVRHVMLEQLETGLEMMVYEVNYSPVNWLRYQSQKRIAKGADRVDSWALKRDGDIILDR